jgi:3-dehydroquinate dehydratase-2
METSVTLGWKRTGTRRLLITVIDGPNMPNLGNRNKRVYGPITSIGALQDFVKDIGLGLGVDVECVVSNHEGDLLDAIH